MTRPGRRGGRRGWAAVVLLLAAAAVHLGVAAPLRRERDAAREDFARAREERETLRSRASRLARQAAVTVRAPAGDAAAALALRASLLRATDGLALGSVQIGAEAGSRGAVAARGRLTAEGRQVDLLRAAGRLAEASSGVVVERVQIATSREGVLRLELEAHTVRVPAAGPGGPRGQSGS
jgi:hypothetical protein